MGEKQIVWNYAHIAKPIQHLGVGIIENFSLFSNVCTVLVSIVVLIKIFRNFHGKQD